MLTTTFRFKVENPPRGIDLRNIEIYEAGLDEYDAAKAAAFWILNDACHRKGVEPPLRWKIRLVS